MAGISKDARKVNRAQAIYDDGVNHWLAIIEDLNSEILEINDILRGYAAGDDDPKYKLTPAQQGALKDRFSFWASFMKSPERALAKINDGLKKQHTNSKSKTQKSQPTLAVFSTKAKD